MGDVLTFTELVISSQLCAGFLNFSSPWGTQKGQIALIHALDCVEVEETWS